MRERLTNLIENEIDTRKCNINIEWLVDYLLENGVVVKECGKWANAYSSGAHLYRCIECGEYIEAIWAGGYNFKYCPNCGVRMDGVEE